MAVTVLGIDLAKNVFALHGVDHKGNTILCKPKVSRAKLLETVANMPPCLIGMEACSSAHFWARLFKNVGHEVRLIAPKFVSPYRLSGKAGKMMLLMLKLSVKQFNVLICDLLASSQKSSNRFNVCTELGRA